jgi:hypothetical protein
MAMSVVVMIVMVVMMMIVTTVWAMNMAFGGLLFSQ